MTPVIAALSAAIQQPADMCETSAVEHCAAERSVERSAEPVDTFFGACSSGMDVTTHHIIMDVTIRMFSKARI